ncbi:hypothetical protein CDD83_8920 [Cordyceps sp. RAO-2017]|nr:hypothetical protein CDD83_8920 [Cordyceps sp. RAO-2017]
MGKKRKASGRIAEPKGPRDVDPADARLGPISTFADVADSEDEFFLDRDEATLDAGSGSKRRRTEDEEMELSDEEVFAYHDSDSDDGRKPKPNPKSGKNGHAPDGDDGEGDEDPEGGDSGWWGSSKQAYYDADNIETEADALEEEAEAKRLQHKKLSKMREEDFVFDGDEWLAAEPDAEGDAEPVIEVLKDVEVPDDMGPEERSKLLLTRYPEFDLLVNEFQELQPTLEGLKAAASATAGPTLESVKYWVLGCYVASLAGYFAVLTSPARDGAGTRKPLAPSELRDHDVMKTLMLCRDAWLRVKRARSLKRPSDEPPPTAMVEAGLVQESESAGKVDKKEKKKKKKDKEEEARSKTGAEEGAAAAKRARRLAKAKAIEDGVADLYHLPLDGPRSKKKSTSRSAAAEGDGDGSDFGEEEALDARAAADKAARKKSLKFYTSQIVQKANRRAGAGRDAGGDMDIPHRERLRDRQARLLAEAEKRGKRGSRHGADLGGDSDEEDGKTASAVRGDEDEYYDMVAHAAKSKRDDKAARYAAYAAASKADRVVEQEQIGEDGKRKVTYAIEKNKGLAPKRSKDVRNPRVKRRKQYDAKQKKLKSMRPVWTGGEPKGGYQGETSGINAAVVKSVKL